MNLAVTAIGRDRPGIVAAITSALLEAGGNVVRGEIRPGGTEREWCDAEVLRRIRRASLAHLRQEVEPADGAAYARFLASWQGIDRHRPLRKDARSGAGTDRLREILVPLQ